MTGFLLKLKCKNGQHVVDNLQNDTTVGKLKTIISEVTKIPEAFLHILIGFPPKPLDLSQEKAAISISGISSGDTLIVEERAIPETASSSPSNPKKPEESSRQPDPSSLIPDDVGNNEFLGILLKKVVPADNSCLFTSIGYVMNGQIDLDCADFMRKIIAVHVAGDPSTYNEAMLGKSNKAYCDWIQRSESWGGAIEVSILSSFYGIEFDVVDITNAIINRFGEDKNYGLRAFLLFDGIHYDPLYLESPLGEPVRTLFPVEIESVYEQAEQLAKEAKSSRQFTDVNKFTLRCIQCDSMLIGHAEAQQHALTTGHTNFGEV